MNKLVINNWKLFVIFLSSLPLITAIIVTVWKKNIRKQAQAKEIRIVAIIASIIMTVSVAIGFKFPGLPWTLIAYVIFTFFVQWLISQKVLDEIWAFAKAYIQKKAGL